MSILVDDELFEVPANVVDVQGRVHEAGSCGKLLTGWWTLTPEKFIKRLCVCSIHFDFLENLEVGNIAVSWPHLCDAIPDLCAIGTRFLECKLIAWESKKDDIIDVFILQYIQPQIMPVQTSERSEIDNDHDLSSIIAEIHDSRAV